MNKRSTRIIISLLFLVTLGQFAVDLYLPSLPHMANALNASPSMVKLTVALYLLGLAPSQLIYGPCSDTFGRKPTLYFGFFLFLSASLGAAFAPNIGTLIGLRVAQGFGSGAFLTGVRAILRDSFKGKAMARVSSFVALFWVLTPVMAPVFGGYLQQYFGWRASFVAMFIYALIILGVILFLLPETKTEHQPLQVSTVWQNYKHVFSSKVFLAFSFMSSLSYSFFISFATASPFIMQNKLGLSPVQFGWALLVVALGTGVGALTNTFLLKHFSLVNLLRAGVILMVGASFAFVIFAFTGTINLVTFLAPPAIVSIGGGIVFPNCTAGAMTPFRVMAGLAGAAFGFIQMINSSIASFLISRMQIASSRPLSLQLFIITILMAALFWLIVRRHFVEEE